MSGARERILAAVRAATGGSEADSSRLVSVRERIARHPRHIEPAIGEPARQRFQAGLETAQASFAAVATLDEVGAEIERYLDSKNLARELVLGDDEVLRGMAWPGSLRALPWEPGMRYEVSLARAFCGIAETGTLLLVSGANNPTEINFLPDYHIALLEAENLVPRMEDAWDRVRASFGKLPRTVNFISGPSKTADIEQTVEYGAHGPRCLHVILVG
ncbi:MAG TPA: LUD domain-containing protein [Gammaproteobacteria bacterium]|jgi:L-lactate dehydrogenase complex protein LldG